MAAKTTVGRGQMEALCSIPLAHELAPWPRNSRQLRNPEVSLSDSVHACLPSWSSLNTRKRPRAHEVQPDHLMSYQCYSLHENNRKLLNGICSLQLIACPLLWPVWSISCWIKQLQCNRGFHCSWSSLILIYFYLRLTLVNLWLLFTNRQTG